eukprot:6184476-Pleurochrysis_carterae.AAC.4
MARRSALASDWAPPRSTALIPRTVNASTWSSIKLTRGDMTTAGLPVSRGGSWKHNDLPLPLLLLAAGWGTRHCAPSESSVERARGCQAEDRAARRRRRQDASGLYALLLLHPAAAAAVVSSAASVRCAAAMPARMGLQVST